MGQLLSLNKSNSTSLILNLNLLNIRNSNSLSKHSQYQKSAGRVYSMSLIERSPCVNGLHTSAAKCVWYVNIKAFLEPKHLECAFYHCSTNNQKTNSLNISLFMWESNHFKIRTSFLKKAMKPWKANSCKTILPHMHVSTTFLEFLVKHGHRQTQWWTAKQSGRQITKNRLQMPEDERLRAYALIAIVSACTTTMKRCKN